ncbi:hypothetical protein B0F90DRAFT_316885 [Multifurca ochricompacta]|uniref:Uncharacterized protein n=1 Tax=Multifurca ochricompacta TaxID=376703 RepID=A0AAD4M4X4_9AGAM|nr:hypothetical protein B0F90DRAFT_316885 [Multifurca ochricompacta]
MRAALSTLLAPYQKQASESPSSSSHTSPRSAKVINALIQLLAKPTRQTQQPTDTASDFAPTPASSLASTAPETTDSDDEIVVLEKENVDPATFRRRNDLQTKPSGVITRTSPPKRKRTLSDVVEAQRRSKRHCDSSPPQRKLTFLSRPLLSDPVTFPNNPVLLQTPRANADLFAARSALVAAAFPSRSTHSGPATSMPTAKGTLKAATSALTSGPIPAPFKLTKPYVIPEWARTTTATKPRMSEEALARREAENIREQSKALERKRVHRRRSRGCGAAEPPPSSPTHPVFVHPSARIQVRRASLGNNASESVSAVAPVMAAVGDVLRTSSPPPPPSSLTMSITASVFAPCTPTRRPAGVGGASRHSVTSSPTLL